MKKVTWLNLIIVLIFLNFSLMFLTSTIETKAEINNKQSVEINKNAIAYVEATGQYKVGNTVVLSIMAKDVERFYACGLTFKFDPKAIKVKSIELGKWIKENDSNLFDVGENIYENYANYNFTYMGDIPGLTGSGEVFKITIEVLNKSKLILDKNSLNVGLIQKNENGDINYMPNKQQDLVLGETLIQEDTKNILRKGNWSQVTSLGNGDGKLIESNIIGDFLEYTFKGTAVRIFGIPNNKGGKVKITLDNESYILDLYSPNDVYVPILNKDNLSDDKHTLKIEILDKSQFSNSSNVRIESIGIVGENYKIEDVNYDNTIDILDISKISTVYNKSGWNGALDVNRDGIVDIYDIVIVSNKIN